MKNITKLFLPFLLIVSSIFTCDIARAGKTVKLKLTGSVYENIMMTVGQTGREEVISSLPYILEVPKDQLPMTLRFKSDNYIYYDINVPKKPVDDTGHLYLVKINEIAMSNQASKVVPPVVQQQPVASVVEGIDTQHGVNAAPVTGAKNLNTFALIIANQDYESAISVENAKNDGLAFKEYCLKTLGLPGENVKFHANLTYGKMRKVVNDIVEIASLRKGEASLLIYYAGHGIPDNRTKDAFLMPVDADGTDTEVCISLDGFYKKLNSSGAKKCVVFLDACFSGANRDGDMIVAARGVKIKPEEAKPKGNTIVFTATSGEEAAFSYKAEEHGLFTYFLLKKLQESKGKCSLGELSDYLKENVSMQSRLLNNASQSPCVHVAAGIEDSWKSIQLNK